ncbi:G-protein coupled receptor GRL101-like [Amphiura filiformis]|uniref:G-protein coupled receptor GRL101-like n=1 Tax=Amphiura filiformis TaxID=82378 RepID=UPI003B20CA0F
MWIVGLAAVVFNTAVIGCRLVMDLGSKVQNVLIYNLALSDMVMGMDLLILTSVDLYYGDYFPSFSESWIKGPLCKIVAALSTLSSEASVLLVLVIGLDRFLGVTYPLGVHRGLGSTRMRILESISWMVSVIIGVAPVVIDSYFPGFYEISEVCVGLPIVKKVITSEEVKITRSNTRYKLFWLLTRSEFVEHNGTSSIQDDIYRVDYGVYADDISSRIAHVSGHKVASYLSIIVYIGINLICFATIAVFYIKIFQTARSSSKKVQSTSEKKELRMAFRMSSIVLTDFACWVPLALVCLFVQCGTFTVGPEMYAWTVGLILPINSAINPFLYTLAVAMI